MTGLVVERASGELTLFLGSRTQPFPAKLQSTLKPHKGKYVRVGYTRGLERGINFIDRIDRIQELHPAVVVEIKPQKAQFRLDEPIVVAVSIKNRSKVSQGIAPMSSTTSVLQDYQAINTLEGDDHYYAPHPYGDPALARTMKLGAGEAIHFTVVSQQMVKAGRYPLVYALATNDGIVLSNLVDVVVASPGSRKAEVDALAHWVTRAAPGQRVAIARQLLAYGDARGTSEVLRLLKASAYSRDNYCNATAFEFAWRHGGSAGQATMLEAIGTQSTQWCVTTMIENVYLSPKRVAVVKKLLANTHRVDRSFDGWADKPRVADITAAWLMGYTNGVMTFPQSGSEAERDAAIARVDKQLRADPAYFSPLRP